MSERRLSYCVFLFIGLMTPSLAAAEVPGPLGALLESNCLEGHESTSAEGGFELTLLAFDLDDRSFRYRRHH